jgi:hypothetical protein
LKELPSSIGQLNAIQELDLLRCSNLKELPLSKTASSIGSEKHVSKFNFALITSRYDMEKPFSCIVTKEFKAIGKFNNIV